MDGSFTPIEQMLRIRASRHGDFPYRKSLLTRLCMHMQGKLLENRNKMLKAQGINENIVYGVDHARLSLRKTTAFSLLELSCALGSSLPNATRIADELEKARLD